MATSMAELMISMTRIAVTEPISSSLRTASTGNQIATGTARARIQTSSRTAASRHAARKPASE